MDLLRSVKRRLISGLLTAIHSGSIIQVIATSMKSLIILVVLFTCAIVAFGDEGQAFRFDLLDPQGVRVSFEDTPGIRNATFVVNIYRKPYKAEEDDQFSGLLELQNGWWTYQNVTVSVNPGDKLMFALVNDTDDDSSADVDDFVINEYIVPDNAVRVPA